MRCSIRLTARVILTSLMCALISTMVLTADAEARRLFVSPSGDGSDGQSWKTAWQSFTTIDWSKVSSGDQLVVDGGEESITYIGAFTIPTSNIVIRQARGKKRNGQVIITGWGQPTVHVGITVAGSNVHIVGARRSGIKITSFGSENIRIQTNNNSLRNVELAGPSGFMPYGQGRVGNLVFGGYNNRFINCDFRGFSRCAVDKPVSGSRNMSVFRNCTFGNIYYGWWGEWGTGIFGDRTEGAPGSTIYAVKCVFGPYLNKGVDVKKGRLSLNNSLLLGANLANLSFEPAESDNALAVVSRCTFYEPNFSGPARYQMLQNNFATNGNGRLSVRNSIIYGGVVHVPAGQVIRARGNVQYHVTGNTTALAPEMLDPQYVQESTLWTPVTATTILPRAWTTQSYALESGSPAAGKGSTITDVTAIVPAYGPNGPLPPLGGP